MAAIRQNRRRMPAFLRDGWLLFGKIEDGCLLFQRIIFLLFFAEKKKKEDRNGTSMPSMYLPSRGHGRLGTSTRYLHGTSIFPSKKILWYLQPPVLEHRPPGIGTSRCSNFLRARARSEIYLIIYFNQYRYYHYYWYKEH